MGFRITGTWMLGVAALACGCASRGQIDILESRLRQQEDSIAQLQGQLTTAQGQLQAARRQADDLNGQLAAGTRTAKIEQLSALGQVEAIELNKYLTGGLDRDGIPGDEMLSVVLAPTDSQGNLVKVPGSVSLTLFDLSQPEAHQRIGRWEFTPKQSEALWYSGFLGSGYTVRVPWQEPPHSSKLLVHARLKTIDGRQFDTSQTINVELPRGGVKPPPASVAAAGKPLPQAKPPASAPVQQASQSNAKQAAAVDTAWWDDAKPPAAPAGDAEPPKTPFGTRPE